MDDIDFDASRLRSSTIAAPKIVKKESTEERKEREKAERKARMEAGRLKKL